MTLSDFIAYVKAFKLRSKAEVDAAILVAVPDQTGHAGEVLSTDGSETSWITAPGATGLAREHVVDALNIPTFL